MSRHRNIRNLDLTEEYDDHHDEELTDEQQDLMTKGYAAVREVFPEDTGVTKKEIEDSLWYYYFDPTETVKWLLRTKKSSEQQQTGPKKVGNISKGDYRLCPRLFGETSKTRTTVATSRTRLAVSKAKNAIDWDSIARRPRGIRLGQCGLLGGASSSKPTSEVSHTSLSSLAALAAKSASSAPPLRTGISGGLGLAALASRATSTSSGLGLRSLAGKNLPPNDPNRTKTSLVALAGNRTQPSHAGFASPIPSPSTPSMSKDKQTSSSTSISSSSTCLTISNELPALSIPSSSSLCAITKKDRQNSPEISTSPKNLPTQHLSLKPSPTDQPNEVMQKPIPISTFVIAQPSSFAVSIFESLIETPVDTTHVRIEESILASGGNPLAGETKITSFAFDTQSPDDVVLRAQSLKGTGTKGGSSKETALVTERN